MSSLGGAHNTLGTLATWSACHPAVAEGLPLPAEERTASQHAAVTHWLDQAVEDFADRIALLLVEDQSELAARVTANLRRSLEHA